MPLCKQSPGSPPRPAPRQGVIRPGSIFLLLFGGIWTAVGLLITTVFLVVGGAPWHDWILEQRGVPSTGEVTAVEPTHARYNKRPVKNIVYQFQDKHGNVYPGRSGTTDPSLLASADARHRLAVEYDPLDPTRNRLAGTRISFFGPLLALPLSFALIGLPLFLLGVRALLRIKWLLRFGEVGKGRVVRVGPSAIRHNRRRLDHVEYTFTTSAGEQSGAFNTLEKLEVGATIWIVYDPANTARNTPAME